MPPADRYSERWLSEMAKFVSDSFTSGGASAPLCVTTDDSNIDVFYVTLEQLLKAIPQIVLEPSLLVVGVNDASKVFVIDKYDDSHFITV